MTGAGIAELRDAFQAIPARVNPHADAATRQLERWVVEQRLIGRTAARQRFGRADFGAFAAVTYPTASEADLALVADWFAWLFLLDDQLDDGLLGRDPGRAGELIGAIVDVLNGLGAPPGAGSIVTALEDLWHRTVATVGPVWCRRFVEHVVAGGMAARWEADNRVRGLIPDEASYVENRRHTGAIYVCLDLIEIVEHIEVPAEVYGSEPFTEARDAAADVVCWTNDLYSVDKETSLGEYHNLVTITRYARGLSRAEAIQAVAGRTAARLREFLAWEPRAMAAGPQWAVAPSLAGMRSWMRGNLDWSARTHRYREGANPFDYLESMLIDEAEH